MSHNHYLSCGACGVTTESESEGQGCNHPGSCYSKFVTCYGDTLVENALATKALFESGIEVVHGHAWVEFIHDHAHCNSFSEVCEHEDGLNGGCEGAPRRVLVKDQKEPCSTCNGSRLIKVPCVRCCGDPIPDGVTQAGIDAVGPRWGSGFFSGKDCAPVSAAGYDHQHDDDEREVGRVRPGPAATVPASQVDPNLGAGSLADPGCHVALIARLVDDIAEARHGPEVRRLRAELARLQAES